MVVIITEKTPKSLCGELTRWLLEVKTGVFVGSVSGIVRDLLWNKVESDIKKGASFMIYSNNNEQGFSIRTLGNSDRFVRDLDGISLITSRL